MAAFTRANLKTVSCKERGFLSIPIMKYTKEFLDITSQMALANLKDRSINILVLLKMDWRKEKELWFWKIKRNSKGGFQTIKLTDMDSGIDPME